MNNICIMYTYIVYGVDSNAEFCTLLFFLLLRGSCTANYLILVYTSFSEMQYNRVPYCQCLFYFTTLRDEDSMMRIMRIHIWLNPAIQHFFINKQFLEICDVSKSFSLMSYRNSYEFT